MMDGESEPASGAASGAASPVSGLQYDDADAATWKRPAPAVEEQDQTQQPSSKKARTSGASLSTEKARGARMFGMLKGTLTKFQSDTAKSAKTQAAQNRQAIESRLHDKLRKETAEMEKKGERIKLEKTLRSDVFRKADELALLDTIVCFS